MSQGFKCHVEMTNSCFVTCTAVTSVQRYDVSVVIHFLYINSFCYIILLGRIAVLRT